MIWCEIDNLRFLCEYTINLINLDLFHSRPLKSQIKAVVCQWPDLGVVTIIAHADDGDFWTFDQANHLLQKVRGQEHRRENDYHLILQTLELHWLKTKQNVWRKNLLTIYFQMH